MNKKIVYLLVGIGLISGIFLMKNSVSNFENSTDKKQYKIEIQDDSKEEKDKEEKETKEITEEEKSTENNEVKEESKVEYNTVADFTLENLAGEEISLSDYQGKKVFINFWATWCGNCKVEMPHIQQLSEEYKDEVVVLAVNVGESKELVQEYIEDNDFTFEVVLDGDSIVSQKYGVTGFPTSVLMDENGNPVYGQVGRMEYEDMVKFISGSQKEK